MHVCKCVCILYIYNIACTLYCGYGIPLQYFSLDV